MVYVLRAFYAVAGLALALVLIGLALPARLVVEREIAIERPMTTVFTLLISARAFDEWSPWAPVGADVRRQFDGPDTGEGASAIWRNDAWVEPLRYEIATAEPPVRATSRLVWDEARALAFDFRLAGSPGGAKVVQTLSVDYGFNLVGRYGGLTARGRLGRRMEEGLLALKAMAESLPGADFAGLGAEIVEVEPQSVVFVADEVRGERSDQRAAFTAALETARGYLAANAVAASGAPIAMTDVWAPPYWRFRAAVPYAGDRALPGDERVSVGATPAGRAVRVRHAGASAQRAGVMVKLDAFVGAHRLKARGGSWEVYLQGEPAGENDAEIVEIYLPVE